ncbi:YceI family protein [Sphingomonas immobilis]|uniref:YceI family protein n=1 Tax=Sphingomonas immobilis TaxID=3063997 RepID=A0ABT8ZW30_9SPHN|nr:YceI family protein [Sphingomonas sp. CA1-15]MDO7841220.1 YceI family protein [Sphingomonas sp. CA1-15]
MRTAPALLLFLAAPAAAQMTLPVEAPGKPDPKIATSGKYKIEPTHTQALFTVTHLGWTYYTGQFTNPTGTLTLDTKRPANSKVSVTFAIDKVLTTVPDLDAHLKGPDFFDAAKFPTATFTSTKVTPTGPATATIAGTLTLHGVTKPVTLKARFIGAGKTFWGEKKMAIGFAATTSIKRSAFGMGANIPLVSDNVDLVINAGFDAD